MAWHSPDPAAVSHAHPLRYAQGAWVERWCWWRVGRLDGLVGLALPFRDAEFPLLHFDTPPAHPRSLCDPSGGCSRLAPPPPPPSRSLTWRLAPCPSLVVLPRLHRAPAQGAYGRPGQIDGPQARATQRQGECAPVGRRHQLLGQAEDVHDRAGQSRGPRAGRAGGHVLVVAPGGVGGGRPSPARRGHGRVRACARACARACKRAWMIAAHPWTIRGSPPASASCPVPRAALVARSGQTGCLSVVFVGGYGAADDDKGDELWYTGHGGRDLSGEAPALQLAWESSPRVSVPMHEWSLAGRDRPAR